MNAAAIAAVALCAQAGLLLVASVVATRQLREARRIREEQAQPYVVVSLETDSSSPSILNLVIKNIGKTAARNVELKFDPPLVSSLDRDGPNRISEWTVLKDGILTLAPGQSMSTLIDSLLSRYAGGDLTQYPGKVQATVRYKGDFGRRKVYHYEYDLDFNVFFGSHWVGRKSFDDLVKAVDEIRKAVESWTTDQGVKVYVKDLDEAVQERQGWWRERALKDKVEELSRDQETNENADGKSASSN
jgi:hypothetical protein